MENVSHENDLIFMRMNEQVTIPCYHLAYNDNDCTKSLATEANVDLELAYLSMSCHRGAFDLDWAPKTAALSQTYL